MSTASEDPDEDMGVITPVLVREEVFPDPGGSQRVLLQQYAIDWSYLDECTHVRVHDIICNHRPGIYYVNPRYSVSANWLSHEFMKRARQCCVAWCRSMSQVMGSSSRRRESNRAPYAEHAAVYSGVLCQDGQFLDLKAVFNANVATEKQHHFQTTSAHRPGPTIEKS
jgi:hypothetical protein